MKTVFKAFCLVTVLFQLALIMGCQNTMSGFNHDVDKNVDEFRKTINS